MKKNLLIVSLVSLCSCTVQQPLVVADSDNNKTYAVAYLFEHDGCKVYRFYDQGRYVYFTNCNGEAITTTDSTQLSNRVRVDKKN